VTVHPVVQSWTAGGTPELGRTIQALAPACVLVMYPSLGYKRGWTPGVILNWLARQVPACGRVLILHEYAMYSFLGHWRLRPALSAAHAVVCTNHHDRRALRGWLSPARKVQVIPLGSAVAPLRGPAAIKVFSANSRSCAHFGMVMPNKGWETLLAGWRILLQSGAGLKLDVAGVLEPDRYAYHARVARAIRWLGLSKDIRFTGYLAADQVHTVFKRSLGVAVMPFRHGAQLNRSSLVAALAAGLAVVTTRPGNILEGLRAGENIWLVKPDDPQALAEGIRRVTGDRQLRQRLQAGARRVAKRFAWEGIARQMLKLVREVTT
jgi:glycosyltransferase involved in cell wall biosynthesis